MLYDSLRGRTVLFGGGSDGTWEWDGIAKSWTNLQPAASPFYGTLDLAFADVDGDRLYLGDGKGGFTDATAGRLPAGASGRIDAVDVDRDGRPDLLCFPRTALGLRLLSNDGKGLFREAPSSWLPEGLQDFHFAVALFDRDGDGDLDLYAGSWNPMLFTNLQRQIHATRLLQSGTPFPLELWGSPGQVALLLAGTTPGALELPPLGTLRIGTPGLFGVGLVPILWGPRAELRLRAPLDPAVSGLEVRLQALMLDPFAPEGSRFTNLLVEKVW